MPYMVPRNILDLTSRADFREWLTKNSATEKECWIAVKRGKTPPEDALWYLDAVEEALCFGWIDSTVKNVGGVTLQRFGPRNRHGQWTEAVCVIMPEIIYAFKADTIAWQNFCSFPGLYQRVRIDNIQRNKSFKELFESRLQKLIEASRRGKMIGDWHDCGRLLEY